MVSNHMPNVPAIQCKALSKQTGKQCKRKAIPGGEVCHWHGGAAKQVKARAGVRAEVMAWGLGDSHVDPGEVLLRLVTQSAARAEMYARLLQEAFDAAERLKQADEEGTNLEALGDEQADTAETARRDLDRIFNTGGVAALVGNTYGAAKDVGVYVTGEAIRGLADLRRKSGSECELRWKGSRRRSCRTHRTGGRTTGPVDGGNGSGGAAGSRSFAGASVRLQGSAGSTSTRAYGFACGLKQLGGHLFCTHRACGLAWCTSTSGHIE
jgi:hypothetical protein